MSQKMNFSETAALLNKSFGFTITVSANAGIVVEQTVAAAQPGVLTTRTSNTAGTLTMTNAGHGIITGSIIDIYWSGGQCRNATVGTVSGTSVPFTLAVGTVLPAATTAVSAMNPLVTPFNVVGNNVQGLSAQIVNPTNNPTTVTDVGTFSWQTSGPAEVYGLAIDNLKGAYNWGGNAANCGPQSNPLAGATVAQVAMSHSLTTGTAVMRTAALFN